MVWLLLVFYMSPIHKIKFIASTVLTILLFYNGLSTFCQKIPLEIHWPPL